MATTETFTYYDLLNIAPDADDAAIRRAWRSAAREDHPDRNGGKASPRYMAAQRAYETLIDPDARRAYDASLGGAAGSSSGTSTRGPRERTSGRTQTAPGNSKTIPEPTIRFAVRAPDRPVTYDPPLPGAAKRGMGRDEIIDSSYYLATMTTLAVVLLGATTLRGFATAPGFHLTFFTALAIVANVVISALTILADAGSGKGSAGLWLLPAGFGVLLLFLPGSTLVAALASFALAAESIAFRCLTRTRRPKTIWGASVNPVMPEDAPMQIYGRPGAGLMGTFAETGEIGALGERVTARMLEDQLLAVLPGARIYHGMKMDITHNDWDVDHVVSYKNRVALIDTKVWAPGRYEVSDYPGDAAILHTLPDGRQEIREVQMNFATTTYRKQLPNSFAVRPFVLVHASRGGVVQEFVSAPNNEMVIGGPQEILAEVAAWLADQPDEIADVDRRLMTKLRGMHK